MTKTKKTLAGLITAGALSTGSIVVSDKLSCDYEFQYEGETICLTENEKRLIEDSIAEQNFYTVGNLTFE